MNPKDAEAPFNRGLAYMRIGKHDFAARDFTEVIGLEPKHADAYVYRGLIRVYQGRENDADADFQRAYRLNPALKKKLESVITEAKAKAKNTAK